jgi:hypothetical protein
MRITYRVGQLWRTVTAHPTLIDLSEARAVLSPALLSLFQRMQPSEQAHSLLVLRRLRQSGETQPDLLAAALLHDVGKTCLPLRPWDRALIVIARGLAPGLVRRWGRGVDCGANARGWRRPFAVAEQHPAWGAEMVQQAGASQMTIELVRYHQERGSHPHLEPWLSKLQWCDDES